MNDVTQSALPSLPHRAPESHKGHYGRLLMIGGSRGMAGAISLAGMAALRSGAGLVTLAVPEAIQTTVASFEPSIMTCALGGRDADSLGTDAADTLLAMAQRSNVVALGPGLGQAAETVRLVHRVIHRIEQPMILDADGLNALASHPELLHRSAGPRVLTPHGGEFERLAGVACDVSASERAEQAAQLCRHDRKGRTVVVIKGHHTILCDGTRFAVNQTGNPGMATGGTGDCLTGVIAALVGQGLDTWNAARLGVHLHGLAGDMAAAAMGEDSLIASDLVRFLPDALKEHRRRNEDR